MVCVRTPLFFILGAIAPGSAIEFHAEHQAVHQTALWRRDAGKTQPDKLKEKAKDKRYRHRDAHVERMMNMSTALQDMKTEYIGTIGVGTNERGEAQFEARVVFDTGSTNLWVASTLCKEFPCNNDRAREFYDPQKSSTQEAFLGEDGDIDIMFGTGELRGPLHVDTYRVGPMEVKRQPFAMIREMNGDVFSSFPFEGILGLGFKSLSFGGINPFFERVIEQRLLDNNEFAFFFNVDSDQPSALLWGGIDKDLYHGPIRMFPVVQAHYWALELVDFKVGNVSMKSIGMSDDPVKRLIVDSGTTYFTAPEGLHEQIVSQIPEADCDAVEKYPPLTYVLKGADEQTYELVVSQETYMIGGYGNSCRPAFMALDVNEQYGPAMILGEVFMRHFFTVFSRGDGAAENAKIGIAPAKIGAVPKVKKARNLEFPNSQQYNSQNYESTGSNDYEFGGNLAQLDKNAKVKYSADHRKLNIKMDADGHLMQGADMIQKSEGLVRKEDKEVHLHHPENH